MTIRLGLQTRIGADVISPALIPGCVLWLDARKGISFSSTYDGPYSDMSGWAKVNCTTTATTITDTADAVPTIHYAKATWTTLVVNQPIQSVSVELKAGTLTNAMVSDFSGGWAATINLTTGIFTQQTNIRDGYIEDVGDGWWRLSFRTIGNTSITIVLSTANAGGNNSYIGDGTGTVQARNWKTNQGIRIESWADQSGNGNNFTQTTVNYQPYLVTDSETPSLLFDATYASKHLTRAYTAAFNSAEGTFVAFHRMYAYGTYRAVPIPLRTSSGVEAFDWWDNGATEYIARTTLAMSAAVSSPTNRTMRALIIGGSNAATSYKDKARTVCITGTVGGASGTTTTGHYIGTRGDDLYTRTHGYVYGVAVYNRAITAAELEALSRYGAVHFGIV